MACDKRQLVNPGLELLNFGLVLQNFGLEVIVQQVLVF